MLALKQGKNMGKVLETNQAKGISARPTTYSKNDDSDVPHYHETSYLTFILQGGALAKRKLDEVDCFPGTLTFYHAGEPHQCLHQADFTKSINFEFDPVFYKENEITEVTLGSSIKRNSDVKFTMLKIYKELLVKDEFTDNSVEMLLLSLVESNEILENKRPEWINKIAELLNDKWNEEVTLKDLSMAANVHPITVSKHFTKYFSCTFGEYRRRLKVEKALQLIRTSNLSLTEIAYECGFYDQSHFTRTFKDLTGFVPRHYEKL